MIKLRCPGIKPHKKRHGDMVLTEDNCNTLLPFVKSGEGAAKCKDCKNIIHYKVEGDVVKLKVLPANTRIDTIEGKVVVDGC